MTPLLLHTFSMFGTVSSHSAGPEYSASGLKCNFALREEACVLVGRAGAENCPVQMLWKQSFGACLWMHELLTFSGFYLLLISLPHSQNLTRNMCCLAKQNEKLCYLKTIFFLVLAFALTNLLRRPKEEERGLLGTIVESREERKA